MTNKPNNPEPTSITYELMRKKIRRIGELCDDIGKRAKIDFDNLNLELIKYAKNLPYYIVLIQKSALKQEQKDMLCEDLIQYALGFFKQFKTIKMDDALEIAENIQSIENKIQKIFPDFFEIIALNDISILPVSQNEIVPILELERERILLENKLKAEGILNTKK